MQWFLPLQSRALEPEGFSGCGSQALELRLRVGALGLGCLVTCGIFHRPGIKPVSPGLAGGFFLTQPPGKPYFILFYLNFEELRRKVDAGETWGTFKRGTPRRHLGHELCSARGKGGKLPTFLFTPVWRILPFILSFTFPPCPRGWWGCLTSQM